MTTGIKMLWFVLVFFYFFFDIPFLGIITGITGSIYAYFRLISEANDHTQKMINTCVAHNIWMYILVYSILGSEEAVHIILTVNLVLGGIGLYTDSFSGREMRACKDSSDIVDEYHE